MFGGRKFNRNSEILRDQGDDKSNLGGTVASVNDGLFQQVNEAENHAKQILKTGQSQYVDGIKQNVLDMIRLWLQEEGSSIFTLYGKMGCGKSFFSARLYQDISAEKELYDTVAFSSQQLYRDTANVRNMLLSVAHQLFITVSACSTYFARYPLNSESIAALTEDVLVKPFEDMALQKTVFIIIDGLDEYPREDCEVLLETLGRLRMRLNPRVKIYFSSRPEAYIMSEMFNDSEHCSYHIEKNEKESHADCARFIDVKCQKAGIEIDETMKRSLIEKSECSLKYLECFFNDISCGAIRVTADFIDSLPMGLSHYYRDQLVRYFGDESLRFYQTKIVPLLELLCVAWRPITIEDASDILGCRESEINSIISRSGTLLWRNNRYVMLYQSESIREFLMDERYCPEKYRIDSQNGNERVLQRLEEMMENSEDLESNLYLFSCAVDHILGKDRITGADWNLLVQVIAHYAHKSDVVFKISRGILEKTPREITVFLRCLYSSSQIEPLLKDCTAVRLIAAATRDKQEQKLQAVLDLLDGQEEYDFMISYGRIRMLRSDSRPEEALSLLQPYLTAAKDEAVSLLRHIHYIDETGRIYRKLKMVTWEENTDLHIQAIQESEQLLQKFPNRNTPTHLYLLNTLSVSYDQIARLCDMLESKGDTALREACGQKLLTVLQLPDCDPKQKGFFLTASEAAFQKGLKLSKTCQQYDPFSDGRIHNLHYSFYALGILYFRKDFPGYNPDKALQYFEDCLSSIEEIAMRPESHVRFIDVVVKLYSRLCDIYTEDSQFALAKKYFAEAKQMRDLRYLYHPSADSDFSRAYSYEQEADIILAEQGIDAAESYFLTAAEHYRDCCQKYPDRFVQRSLEVVYYRLAKKFKDAGNLEKFVYYSRLELKEIERMYALFPSKSLRWDWGVSQEILANTLRKLDPTGTLEERLALQESAVSIFRELTATYPQEQKYFTAPFVVYYRLLLDYCDAKMYENALEYLDAAFDLGPRIAAITRDYDDVLDLPIRMFLHIYEDLADKAVYQKYFDTCKAYIETVKPYCPEEEDFESMRLNFLRREARDIRDTQGIKAAESLLMDYLQQAKEHAAKWPSPSNYNRLAYGYTVLYEGYKNNTAKDKAIRFLQEALEVLDLGIQQWPGSTDIRELQAILYGRLAELLKQSTDISQISETVDLYILQIKSYILLYKDEKDQAEKDGFGKKVADISAAMTSYLRKQEGILKLRLSYPSTSKDMLRNYVKVLINGYSFLLDFKVPEAQEKLDYYTELQSQLESQ
ncbi:MAG: NACHT domain-containing protein [Ruminococcaceae bacterium]|nr:NACHT domain-containing protein [Oscillospiraceae bacterium]